MNNEIFVIDILSTDDGVLPSKVELHKAYPNPFNPVTNINFTLPYTMQVEINILDIQGRKVRNISSSSYVKGLNSVTVDANDLSSGIYFVELLAEDTKEYTKIMLLK